MRNEALSLYISRKSGKGQSGRWKVRTFLSTLLVFFISMTLAFALVFVFSMGEGLDRLLQLLGSGSMTSSTPVESSLLPEDSRMNQVRQSAALALSQKGSELVSLKGVDDDYFFQERAEAINLVMTEEESNLQPVVLSSYLAHSLGLEAGDRLTVMIYDESYSRVRPVILFVRGIYSTGYREFDSSLIFSTLEVVTEGDESWEIYTPHDVDELEQELVSQGYKIRDYRQEHRAVYENISLSVSLLNVIVALIAFLAGFLSISVSTEYIERDKKDIAYMLLSGTSVHEMVSCYTRITMRRLALALAAGLVTGLCAVSLTIHMLGTLDVYQIPALQSYVTSFSIRIPFLMLFTIASVLLLSSYICLRISLRYGIGRSLYRSLVS